jgi:hypothetical protein
MGMDLNIYTKGLSSDLLPKIKKRFADFSMNIEFHPEFKFDEQTDSGFCPIKLKLQSGHSELYDKFGDDILTGFEINFDNYNYAEELKEIQSESSNENKKSFLSNLFGNKNKTEIKDFYIENKIIDNKLKRCNKNLILNWQSGNKSELRISLYFGAILAELTDGVIYDPQNGRYLTGQQAIAEFPSEIMEYEKSFSSENFTLHKFEKW